jgi:hypothetical protein
MMSRAVAAVFFVALAAFLHVAPGARAQQRSLKDSIAGPWMFVSVIAEQSDGTRTFMGQPQGRLV